MRVDMDVLTAEMGAEGDIPSQINPMSGTDNIDQSDSKLSTKTIDPTTLLQDNSDLRRKLEIAMNRIKRLTMEKNRLVDISNSVRAHVRSWKENQENTRVDGMTQSML